MAAALSVLGAPLDPSGLILAGLALTIAGAVLIWVPTSNGFFRQARAASRAVID